MNEEITASYIFNADALLPAYVLNYRRKMKMRLGLIVAICIIWLVSFYTGLNSSSKVPAYVYAIAIVGVSLLGIVIWWVMQTINKMFWKRRINSMPICGKEVKWIATNESLKCLLTGADSTMQWNLILESIEAPTGALVYPQKHLFYWFPKYAFTSEADYTRFLDLLAAKTKHSKLG